MVLGRIVHRTWQRIKREMTNMMNVRTDDLHKALSWLADAPLFIDADLVSRFHDAVVQPACKEGVAELTVDEQTINKLRGRMMAESELSPGSFLKLLSTNFSFLDFKVQAEGEGEIEHTTGGHTSEKIQLHPIDTPQRQLVQLALHYTVNHPERLLVVDELSDEEWRSKETCLALPRAIVFLDIPPETLIIPMAAEFEAGTVVRFFEKYRDDRGGGPPGYPQEGNSDARKSAKREYWKWFALNVSSKTAMHTVEDAARGHQDRIQWIDFRVLIGNDGDNFHLHLSPLGAYFTGVFAYNFVQRCYRHGIRLVGTLKSQPDINVLAVYEK